MSTRLLPPAYNKMEVRFMKSYSVREYIDAGCPEICSRMYLALHEATDGRICDGCYLVLACQAYAKLTSVRPNTGFKIPAASGDCKKVWSETIREEARRRGLSISEVRRQRKNGGATE